jgi:hypothetical protein
MLKSNQFLAKAPLRFTLSPSHKWDGNELKLFFTEKTFNSLPFGFSQRFMKKGVVGL